MNIARHLHIRVTSWLEDLSSDRGDVPGWVLVTVMTAGLVTAIWLIADDQLTQVPSRDVGPRPTPVG
jgi:hypothetical protein